MLLAKDDAGADVRFTQEGLAYVDADTPRMYRLVNNRELGNYELTLSTTAAGLALYAFTFVSCQVAEPSS